MNCKICDQEYNDSIRQPKIIIPCCHTFCSVCMENKLYNLLCYDCGNQIQESRTNIAILDVIEQSTKANFQQSIIKIETNLKLFSNEYGSKLKENNEKLDEIDKQIENRVNQLVETIFQSHFKIREQLKQHKLELEQQFRESSNEEKIKMQLDLIKSNQNNSDSVYLNDDLNIIMQQINIKFNNLEQFKFEIKFKQNDLITENKEDIIGLLIKEPTLIETSNFEMRTETRLISTVTNESATDNILDIGIEVKTSEKNQVEKVTNKEP